MGSCGAQDGELGAGGRGRWKGAVGEHGGLRGSLWGEAEGKGWFSWERKGFGGP